MSETIWLVLVAGILSASAVTMAAWQIARTDPRLPDRVVGELGLARWAGIFVAAVGGTWIGLSAARPDLALAHYYLGRVAERRDFEDYPLAKRLSDFAAVFRTDQRMLEKHFLDFVGSLD